MFASVTTGHTAREIRSTRIVGQGDERRTIRVQQGRGNTRRAAIAESLRSVR